MHFARKFSRWRRVQESVAGVTYLSMRMHPKNCRIFPLKVATTLLSGSRRILKETTETVGPFGTMPQEPWHPGIGTKLDCVIQLNCGEVRTHASYKTTRTWENFNNRGTKMILLSDKLWLIAHNSKSFANGTGVSQ